MIFYFLSFFWLIREAKAILFWLYLWQLKEYHIGRFLDHFRTEKGKRLLINKFNGVKIFFIATYFILPAILILGLYFIFFIYILETIKTLKDFFENKLKAPILTKKTIFLISIGLITEFYFLFFLFQAMWNVKLWEILFLHWFTFWLLVFDILTPLIVLVIVLLFQPLAVIGRNQIIRKAKKKREQFKDLIVIGITGSYGKTSTKEFLATILAEKYKVLKTKEHQNSEVGISQCILNDLKPEHQIFVVEMGAYNRGGIKLLCDIAKPKIGILTGINEQHMATFGSQENIIKTKFELIENLPEEGIAILNWDNELIKLKTQSSKFKIKSQKLCSLKEKVDFWAEDIIVEKEFISFKVCSKHSTSSVTLPSEGQVPGEWADFKLNLIGTQNVINILIAACCAKELGMSLKDISQACQEIKPEQGGIVFKKGINGLDILDSTYSANPDGVISHLEYLKIWLNKRVIVMPCLIELGKTSRETHRRIGQKIGEVCNLAIITTKERLKEIKEGAMEMGMKEENILFFEEPKKIFEKIKEFSEPGDVILLESRVPFPLIDLLIE